MENKIAVSACLVGKNTKYDGKNNYNEAVIEYIKDKEVILICPEVSGNMSIPRIPCEIKDNKVINKINEDKTINFYNGAKKELDKLLKENVKIIIVKEKSPSCGLKYIYDGTFSGKIINGSGIFTSLALKHNFTIYSEKDIERIINKKNWKVLFNLSLLFRFLILSINKY